MLLGVFLSKKRNDVVYSQNFRDSNCLSISDHDRKTFMDAAKLAIVKQESEIDDVDQEEVAEMFGYNKEDMSNEEDEDNQVLFNRNFIGSQDHIFRNQVPKYGYIHPVLHNFSPFLCTKIIKYRFTLSFLQGQL